jgi:hypothetical protein
MGDTHKCKEMEENDTDGNAIYSSMSGETPSFSIWYSWIQKSWRLTIKVGFNIIIHLRNGRCPFCDLKLECE